MKSLTKFFVSLFNEIIVKYDEMRKRDGSIGEERLRSLLNVIKYSYMTLQMKIREQIYVLKTIKYSGQNMDIKNMRIISLKYENMLRRLEHLVKNVIQNPDKDMFIYLMEKEQSNEKKIDGSYLYSDYEIGKISATMVENVVYKEDLECLLNVRFKDNVKLEGYGKEHIGKYNFNTVKVYAIYDGKIEENRSEKSRLWLKSKGEMFNLEEENMKVYFSMNITKLKIYEVINEMSNSLKRIVELIIEYEKNRYSKNMSRIDEILKEIVSL